jgi:hypothetical protein
VTGARSSGVAVALDCGGRPALALERKRFPHQALEIRHRPLLHCRSKPLQIPTQAGHPFRFDVGHPSGLKPVHIPI